MAEQLIEVANFAAGIRDVPAFERSEGGASRMVNYIVDPDGEVIPRPGYVASSESITHIGPDGFIRGEQVGPIIAVDNKMGVRHLIQLPAGASWVVEQEKMFYTVPTTDRSARWIDLSGGTVSEGDIYRWSANNDRGGDNVRPSHGDSYFKATPVHAGAGAFGLSHPVILELTNDAPTPNTPIEIVLRAASSVSNFKLSIVIDEPNSDDDLVWTWPEGDGVAQLAGNQTYTWQWAGQDQDYDDFEESVGGALESFWRWITNGPVYAGSTGNKWVTQERFDSAFLEVKYAQGQSESKYRYYLRSHRSANTEGEVASAIQAGLTVAGVAPTNPYVLGAGAAVAVAGTAGSIINRTREGHRVELNGRLNTPITPASEVGGGFQVGQYVFCHTYSNEDRTIETIPSRTTEMMMFDFPNIQSAVSNRTRQRISIEVGTESGVKSPSWDWATQVNVYAARTDNPDAHEKLPQELGLEFALVAVFETESITSIGRSVLWTDELYYSEEGNRDDPLQALESYENDQPLRALENIVSYGSRIWGVNPEDNTLRYSKVGPTGYHYFPFENTLVPQSISIDKAATPIVHIHPAPNDSLLYVFRHDTIHFLRGHGEIRGLYTPGTPLDIDVDASARRENIGTSYPRTVTTLKDSVMFLGSDKILYTMSGLRIRPFSLSIQPHIDKYSEKELKNAFAFEYRNCYHLALPNEVLVLDIQKGYWTMFDWAVKDVFWAQGPENTLYAILQDGRLMELYNGDTDAGESFVCEWESNEIKVPYQTVISGVHVYHDGSSGGPLSVSMKSNDRDYDTRTFTPAEYNRFRQGFHTRGQRIQVKITDYNESKLRIDRIALETAQ